MGMFAKLTTDNLEKTTDTLGGGFEAVPSDVYDATIKVAYVGKSQSSDAMSITIHADCDGKEIRETIWVTNKNGENSYPDKKDKTKKIPLPGFATVDDLCLLTTGAPLAEQDTEEKILSLYNFEQRGEVNTPVETISGLTGAAIKLGVLRQIVSKQKKNDAGVYVDTDETRTENTIDKVFHAETGRTVNEYRHEVETAEFMAAWLAKNGGKDRNRVKSGGAGVGSSGAGKPSGSASPRRNLFNK